MDDDGAAFFTGLVLGIILAFVLVAIFINPPNQVICEYEGGQLQGEVCIVNDRVFDLPSHD